MNNLDEARSFFEKDIYATQTTGIQIDAVDTNYSKCSLKISEKHFNAVQGVMGGVIFTLADFAFAVATNSKENVTVTATSQISYLGATKGDTLFAECNLVKDGNNLCFYEIMIYDNLNKKIALVSTTGYKL